MGVYIKIQYNIFVFTTCRQSRTFYGNPTIRLQHRRRVESLASCVRPTVGAARPPSCSDLTSQWWKSQSWRALQSRRCRSAEKLYNTPTTFNTYLKTRCKYLIFRKITILKYRCYNQWRVNLITTVITRLGENIDPSPHE